MSMMDDPCKCHGWPVSACPRRWINIQHEETGRLQEWRVDEAIPHGWARVSEPFEQNTRHPTPPNERNDDMRTVTRITADNRDDRKVDITATLDLSGGLWTRDEMRGKRRRLNDCLCEALHKYGFHMEEVRVKAKTKG